MSNYLTRHLWIVQGKDGIYYPQPNDDPYPIPPPIPERQIDLPLYPIPDLPGQVLGVSADNITVSGRLYRQTTDMRRVSILADTLRWLIRSDVPTADSGPFRLFYAMDTKKLYMVIFGEWQMVGTLKHSLLDGLLDDQHPQYLNEERHNDITKHRPGDNVPHDSHANLSGLDSDGHTQYLNTERHDVTDRHPLGSVVAHDAFTGLIDTPDAYEDKAHHFIRVNEAEDGLEFYNLDVLGRLAGDDLPAADAGYRGQYFLLEGGVGIADKMYVCVKDEADAYVWVEIPLTFPS